MCGDYYMILADEGCTIAGEKVTILVEGELSFDMHCEVDISLLKISLEELFKQESGVAKNYGW